MGVQVKPPQVMAIGPSRYVNTIQQVSTEPFDVNGLNSDVERRVDLESPNPAVALTAMRVDAKVSVGEKITDREIKSLPIEVQNADYRFRVEPSRATVVVRGPMLKLESLDPSGLAYVDARLLEPGSHIVAVEIDVPDGIQVVRQSPGRVKLKLYREKRSAAVNEHAS